MTRITALRTLNASYFITASLLPVGMYTAMSNLVAEGYADLRCGDFSITEKGITELQNLEKAQYTRSR